MDEHRACTFMEHGFYLMYVKGILSVVIRGRLGCLLSNRPKTQDTKTSEALQILLNVRETTKRK